jgi:hypothetical protein
MAAGNIRVAANASVELSTALSIGNEGTEAQRVLNETIEMLPPWCSFELGLCYRALATVVAAATEGDTNNDYIRHLSSAISHFDSSGAEEWSYPLVNKIGQHYLKAQDWHGLQALLVEKNREPEGPVAPIAITIRKYLWSQLNERNLNLRQAAEQLVECSSSFMQEGHELYEEALDSLLGLLARMGITPEDFVSQLPHLVFKLPAEFLHELEVRALPDATLY